MRNGFKSSRGAMRGTMGGAPICLVGVVGFATVAIGIGPFVCSIYSPTSAFTWPISNRLRPALLLAVCSELPTAFSIRIAARRGTEMEKLTGVPKWNRESFIHVHPANRVTHQAPPQPAAIYGSS